MNSLWEVEYQASVFMKERSLEDGTSLWRALMRSAQEIHGAGCDGFLLATVAEHVQRLLAKLDDAQMRKIWLETENGMMSAEEGYDEPERWEMLHDIGLDAEQHIAEEICDEARNLERRRKKRLK